MTALNDELPNLPWLEITPRGRDGAIRLSPLEPLPEPVNLGLLKRAITDRWGVVPLIDMLKESLLRSNCPSTITAMVGRSDLAGVSRLGDRPACQPLRCLAFHS